MPTLETVIQLKRDAARIPMWERNEAQLLTAKDLDNLIEVRNESGYFFGDINVSSRESRGNPLFIYQNRNSKGWMYSQIDAPMSNVSTTENLTHANCLTRVQSKFTRIYSLSSDLQRDRHWHDVEEKVDDEQKPSGL